MHTLCSRYPKLFGFLLLMGIACGALLLLMAIGKAYAWGYSGEIAVSPGIYSLAKAGANVLISIACALVFLLIALLFMGGFPWIAWLCIFCSTIIIVLDGGAGWDTVCGWFMSIYNLFSFFISIFLWAVVIIYAIFELPKKIWPTSLKIGLWLASKTSKADADNTSSSL